MRLPRWTRHRLPMTVERLANEILVRLENEDTQLITLPGPRVDLSDFNEYVNSLNAESYAAHVRHVEAQLRDIFFGISLADVRFPITNPDDFIVTELPQSFTLPELPTVSYDDAMRMLEAFSRHYDYLTESVGAMSNREHAEIREQLGLDPILPCELDAGYDTSDAEAGRKWSKRMFRPELDRRPKDGWSNGAHP